MSDFMITSFSIKPYEETQNGKSLPGEKESFQYENPALVEDEDSETGSRSESEKELEDIETKDDVEVAIEQPNPDSLNAWFYNEVYTYFQIAFFAIIGCLIRLGVDKVMGGDIAKIESSSTIITQSFFSNMLGSFILGILSASTLKKYADLQSLYTGISTGLCGSITTFSKWNQQISLLFIGESHLAGQPQTTAVAAIFIDIFTFHSSLQCGKDLSLSILSVLADDKEESRGGPKRLKHSKIVNPLAVILAIGIWVALLTVGIIESSNSTVLYVLICGVMAPFGAICRYLLAKFNGRNFSCWPSFLSCLRPLPLGTFLANFLGAGIIAATHVIMMWVPMNCLQITIVRCIQSGFLACLTTISTFMSEISNFRSKNELGSAWLYPLLTIVLSQILACIINGVSHSFMKEYPIDKCSSDNATLTF